LPDAEPPWLDVVPRRFRRPLALAAAGELPPNVALMHVLMEATNEAEAREVLAAAARGAPHEVAGALFGLVALLDRNPVAFAAVKAVLCRVAHGSLSDTPEATVRALAAAFDGAVRAAPEASNALYALGSPELLREATAEIVAALRRWGVLNRQRRMLEIGCGIGRFEEALAPELALAVGIDVSRAMLEAARARCACQTSAAFLQTSGLDLACWCDRSFDLVLAVDAFPYLFQAGRALVGVHVAEAARVLRPGGDFVILNLSYRGDLDADRRDLAEFAVPAFEVRRDGTREFRLWDGAAFHLVRRSAT
jgi:SAM-dependent methyltransferase